MAAVAIPPIGTPASAPPAPISLSRFACGANFEPLRAAILNTPCKCALVFVHGFNTTFAFAMRRTAQIAQDLAAEGVVVVFSPGAAGRFVDYTNDVEASELAVPALNRLLTALSAPEAGVRPHLDLIAHSMGARVTLRALTEGPAPKLDQVILPAADIEPGYFLRQARAAAASYERMTVYTSEYDLALSASKAARGGWARLGAGLPKGLGEHLSKVDVVDATAGADDYYGHSYFAQSETVVNDLRQALAGVAAQARPPLTCEPQTPGGARRCAIPCPEGQTCRPGFYARLLRWLLD
jgi:esterase/lipase superfamily enzyme